MGVATAIAAVGAGTAVYGAVSGKAAGSQAAAAQGQIAQEQLAQARKAEAFAAPTADELSTLNNQVTMYNNAYSNASAQLSTLQKQITDTYGSNIIEMGQQLHDQLLGADSTITRQANDQIDRQRQQLQQSLTDKLGPGALQSSAGIQAMSAFDRQAQQGLAQTRDQALNSLVGRLGGLQGSQSQSISGVLGINQSLTGMLGQIQNTQNNFQTRQANASMGVAQYAGADQVQNLAEARNNQNFSNAITGLGSTIAGAGLSSALSNGGSAAKTSAPDPVGSPSLASGTFDANTSGRNFNLGSLVTQNGQDGPSGFASNSFGYGDSSLTGTNLNFTPVGNSAVKSSYAASPYFNKMKFSGG